MSAGTLALVIIVTVVVIVLTIVVVAAPRVTLTNDCPQPIHSRQTFPVVGEVTFDLAHGESKNYLIPPGSYEFRYDGHEISATVPLIGDLGPYKATGDINASYESQPILAGRPLRESIGLGDNPGIVLCPTGR